MPVEFHTQHYIEHRASPEALTGCWLWTGQLDKNGYGQYRTAKDSKWFKAHRVSYEVFKGAIPEDHHVLHKCDTPCCVNPTHLFTGTHQDNVHDCVRKNRHIGPTMARTVLARSVVARTKQTSDLILSAKGLVKQFSRKEVAQMLNVSASTIDRALRK
jgi:hypothetical protein